MSTIVGPEVCPTKTQSASSLRKHKTGTVRSGSLLGFFRVFILCELGCGETQLSIMTGTKSLFGVCACVSPHLTFHFIHDWLFFAAVVPFSVLFDLFRSPQRWMLPLLLSCSGDLASSADTVSFLPSSDCCFPWSLLPSLRRPFFQLFFCCCPMFVGGTFSGPLVLLGVHFFFGRCNCQFSTFLGSPVIFMPLSPSGV